MSEAIIKKVCDDERNPERFFHFEIDGMKVETSRDYQDFRRIQQWIDTPEMVGEIVDTMRKRKRANEVRFEKTFERWDKCQMSPKERDEIYQSLVNRIGKECCEICGLDGELLIHHRDCDQSNNDLDNLMLLCSVCHRQWHHHFPNWRFLMDEDIIWVLRRGYDLLGYSPLKTELDGLRGDRAEVERHRKALVEKEREIDSRTEMLRTRIDELGRQVEFLGSENQELRLRLARSSR